MILPFVGRPLEHPVFYSQTPPEVIVSKEIGPEPVGTISVSVIVRMGISLSEQKRCLHTYDYASLIVPTDYGLAA